ncbi:MAG: hypothetical protein AAF688_02420 [Bacteroidota bacterium]
MKNYTYLLLLLSLPILGQDSPQLKLNLKKGEVYHTTITSINPNSLTKETTNHEIFTVKEADQNEFLVELEISKIVIKTNNNGKPVNYDSSKNEAQMSPAEKALHSRIKPALNTVVSENINRQGLFSNRKRVSGQLNAQMASQKSNLIQLPNTPISIDSTWTQDNLNGNIEIQYTYLVTNINATTVYLECLGIPKSGLKGTVEGKIELDRKTGIPFKKDMKLDLDLNGQILKSDITITMNKQ